MGMNRKADVLSFTAHLYRQACLGNQIACVDTYNACAEDPPTLWIKQQFSETFTAAQAECPAAGGPWEDTFLVVIPWACAPFSVSPAQAISGSV